MLRLRDIMTTELITVAPELTLREAMELLVNEHVSGAPVVAQNKVVGVVSATDLLAFAAAASPPSQDSRSDSAWDVTEGESEPVDDNASISWLPEPEVNDAEDVSQRFSELLAAGLHDPFSEHTVSDVMSHNIRSLPSGTRVDEAAEFMRSAAIHRVLVIDDGLLTGIVTMKDIADAVADHKLTARAYVFPRPPELDRPVRHPRNEH